jgi:hypothetical protein
LLAIVVAAGFESSAWIGGVIFAASALPIGIASLITANGNPQRRDLTLKAAAAAVLTLVIAFPFLRDEFAATAARHAGAPIAFRPYEVLGQIATPAVRSVLNLPAYWFILLPIEFLAIYFAGTWAIGGTVAARGSRPAEKRLVLALTLLAGISFIVPWLFASTIANNDLGWRGVLPGILALTVFAAAGLARWLSTARRLASIAVALLVLGLPGGLEILKENAVGLPTTSAPVLAQAPQLWAAVRRHTAPEERVANNPAFLGASVRWPVNISWALLADRRSCYAGWNLARAFVPLPEAEIDRIAALFDRVFAGDGTPDEVRQLATHFDCRVIVLTPSDGAWRRDTFATSLYFRLVEENPGRWRIYRVIDAVGERN